MSSPRKKYRVLNAFFLIFVILITLWLVVSSAYLVLRTLAQKENKLPSLFGYQISVEMTGQMGEIVPNGSVVLVEEKPNPSVGDIILTRLPRMKTLSAEGLRKFFRSTTNRNTLCLLMRKLEW